MFGKENSKEDKGSSSSSSEKETVIGASVMVDGDFRGDGNILVEGKVKGKLKTNGNVRVAAGAALVSSIEAKNASVAGEVQGNIKAKDRLEVEASARILGDIHAKTLSIAEGAVLNGQVTMHDPKAHEKEESIPDIENIDNGKKKNSKNNKK